MSDGACRRFIAGTGAAMVGLFGIKTRAQSVLSDDADHQVAPEKRHAALESLAKAAEPEVLAARDGVRAAFAAEQARQVAGYKFDCKRFGDFLSLFMERHGNPDRPSYISELYTSVGPERKFSTTLNIAQTREIVLKEGHGADDGGIVEYCEIYGNGALEVYPDLPSAPYDRAFFCLDSPPSRPIGAQMQMTVSQYRIQFITSPYPRAALDDKIRFNGISAEIYAPFGLGASVLGRILREIKERGR